MVDHTKTYGVVIAYFRYIDIRNIIEEKRAKIEVPYAFAGISHQRACHLFRLTSLSIKLHNAYYENNLAEFDRIETIVIALL